MFAEVLDAETEVKDAAHAVDVPKLLEAYNDRRFEDVRAACELSEEAFGGSRTMRPAFAAQLFLMVLLNKTFGLVAPKVSTPSPATAHGPSGEQIIPFGRDTRRSGRWYRSRREYRSFRDNFGPFAMSA